MNKPVSTMTQDEGIRVHGSAHRSVKSSASSGYGLPILVSVFLHLLLVVFVVWGWDSSATAERRITPKYVEAKLVTLKPQSTKKQSTPKTQKKKVINLAEKRKQQALLKKRQKQAEDKRRAAVALAKKKKLDKQKADKEKELKAQADRKRLEDLKALELAEQQRLIQETAFSEALAEEEAMLQAESDTQQAQSYIGAMAALIEQQWSRPPSARRGMQCELSIQLIPTGEVIHVSVVKSSGNSAFDRSAEQAVKKVGRFEVLKDVSPLMFDQYFRQLTLRFNPQDLRL